MSGHTRLWREHHGSRLLRSRVLVRNRAQSEWSRVCSRHRDSRRNGMKRINLLGSLGLAALLAGCMVHGSGGAYVSGPSVAVVEVESEPPPPRVVRYESRPGFLWIEGRWNWNGGQWVWMDG